MPRVSVVLPSYNHEQFISEAIDSVLSQSFSDLELVVVDDGSQDASAERIRAFSDPRLVKHFQQNRGAHAALNKGLELSNPDSDFVCILNSDDTFQSDWVRRCIELLDQRPELGFCAGRVEMFGDVSDARRRWYEKALSYYHEVADVERALLHANFIVTTSNVCFRRALLDRIGGFRPLRYTHDLDFFLRLAESAGFALLDEELVRYRIHASNTIAETQRDEGRLIYEFGWIVADRVRATVAHRPDPDDVFSHVGRLALSLPVPESGAVALVVLALRSSWDLQGLPAQQAELRAQQLLDEASPVLQGMLALDPDSRRKYIAGLEQSVADQERINAEHMRALEKQRQVIDDQLRAIEKQDEVLQDQEQQIEVLSRTIDDLLESKYYRSGMALANAKGLRGLARLPGELRRIAEESRQRQPSALPAAGIQDQATPSGPTPE